MIKETVKEVIEYESKGKNKLGLPYLQIVTKEYKDGGFYSFCRRNFKNSVKFILVDVERGLIGVLDSLSPQDNEDYNYLEVFGESLDELGENPIKALKRGLKEEAGYSSELILPCGLHPTSNCMDELAYLYAVKVTDRDKIARELEDGEETHTTVWIDNERDLLNKCSSLVQSAYLNLKIKAGFSLK